jgi:hypothetical protein
MTKPVIDFSLFLVIWNQQQNMRTPAIHLQMADWLQGADVWAGLCDCV